MRLAVTYWVFHLPEVWHGRRYAGRSDLIAVSWYQQVANPSAMHGCLVYSHCQFV